MRELGVAGVVTWSIATGSLNYYLLYKGFIRTISCRLEVRIIACRECAAARVLYISKLCTTSALSAHASKSI
jgi:hypothetical protein